MFAASGLDLAADAAAINDLEASIATGSRSLSSERTCARTTPLNSSGVQSKILLEVHAPESANFTLSGFGALHTYRIRIGVILVRLTFCQTAVPLSLWRVPLHA